MMRASWTNSSGRASTRSIWANVAPRSTRPGTGGGLLDGRRPLWVASVHLLLASLLWGCSGGGGAGGSALTVDRLCDTIYNALECGRAIEAYELPRAPRGVRRANDSLVLPLANDSAATFVDDDAAQSAPDQASYHTYRAYYAGIGYYLVAHYMYEGSQYVLVSRHTGRRQPVFGIPVLSPDSQRLAVANADLVAEYTPNVLQVWHVGPDGLRLEWQVRPDNWGAEDPHWLAPDTLAFKRVRLCDGAPCDEPARLVRMPGGWRVETP